MQIDDARLIFYHICNELWKLKLEPFVEIKQGKETESVQFHFPKSNKKMNQFAAVQYNQVGIDQIGIVILRFYYDALVQTRTRKTVLNMHNENFIENKTFAKYVGSTSKDYCEFKFDYLDKDRTVIKDIHKLITRIGIKLEKEFGAEYLLYNLPEVISKLPTAIK